MPAPIDLTGQTFGRLTVLNLLPERRFHGYRVWLCQCECGEKISVPVLSLRNNHTRSCGCLNRDTIAEIGRTLSAHSVTHGLSHHPLYDTWATMVRRCESPRHTKWADYGGRGITVCERWRGNPEGLMHFIADMGERPEGKTLDRIDNDGPYSPDNCRWATAVEQMANRR